MRALSYITKKTQTYYLEIIIFLLPFIFFHWMLPFVSDISMSRDFTRFTVWSQMECMLALRTGTVPLYGHLITGGLQASAFLTGWGQFYLPIPYIASLLPGYWTGNALQWNILLFLLMIPVAHLSIFIFLDKININRLLAFLLSTTVIYSFRILLSFTFGVGLMAWVGHFFLCAVIGLYYIKRSRLKEPLLIIFTTYWIINSGHPEEAYFGLLGAVLFTLFIPYLLAEVLPEVKASPFVAIFSFWCQIGVYITIGVLLSSAYLVPFYFDVVKTLWSEGQTYRDSLYSIETVIGLFSNFFSPLRASFFAGFGNTPLLTLPVLVPTLKLFRFKLPKIIWIIWVIIILTFFYILGDKTPIHHLLWKYFPLASDTRMASRISLILPIMFMLILIWLFQTRSVAHIFKTIKITPISSLSLLGCLLFPIYILATQTPHQPNIAEVSLANLPAWIEPSFILLSAITLVTIIIFGLNIQKKRTIIFVCILASLQIFLLFKYSLVFRKVIEPTDIRTYEKAIRERKNSMTLLVDYLYPYDKKVYANELVPQLKNYFLEPHLGKIYRKYRVAQNRDAVYRILNKDRKQDEVIIENCPERPAGQHTSQKVCQDKTDRVNLTYSSYNKMIFKAVSCQPAFFVFSYVRDGHWTAYVNGQKTHSYRANGYAHAVPLPSGNSTVEFRYWSWAAFWGMLLSCATLALIGIAAGILIMRNPAGYDIAMLAIAISCSLFTLWYKSLYTGDNLHTQYTWISIPPNAPENIAFGKPTCMSSGSDRHPYMHDSRNGVDGGHNFSSCFVTGDEYMPWWEVDLLQTEKISSLILYASLQGVEYDKIMGFMIDNLLWIDHKGIPAYKIDGSVFNALPLVVCISNDHENWKAALIQKIDKDKPNVITFENPVTARYIKIMASGKCRLSLNEVEVYSYHTPRYHRR